MTTPGEANAAARSAGEDAGTGQADSTTVSCDIVRVGIFFDGTGNSRDHIGTNHIDSWHTNIDLLERLYKDSQEPETITVVGQQRQVRFGKAYMRGIGIEAGGGNQQGLLQLPYGLGWGTGPEGVAARVGQGVDRALEIIREKAQGLEPCDVWIDTFGFSRGACGSRDFANKIKQGRIIYAGHQARIKFMGLFDTVSSLGEGGNIGSYPEEDVDLSTRNTAEKIFHITAMDEMRFNFPLTLASGGARIEMVGAHADIGGGYFPGTTTGDIAYEVARYRGFREKIEEKWGIQLVLTRDERNVQQSMTDQALNDRLNEIHVQTYGDSFGLFDFQWEAEHGLQHVSLRLMHDAALIEDVPFEPFGGTIDNIPVPLDGDLKLYYNAIKDPPHRADPDLELRVRRKYTHLSVRNHAIGAYDPEPDGIRRKAAM